MGIICLNCMGPKVLPKFPDILTKVMDEENELFWARFKKDIDKQHYKKDGYYEEKNEDD